ncbi:Glyoxalase domain-containing protein 4 [Pseudolycoriella hygida]|uniref:Glyoxalase domain-containing protein 4 n=1 Tax=Pseudolycoriella hygida TaxID=35572 RepID=A0A9Q0MS32_9DIPT|nr:Glyoxalase domain-containing protein 4 [Pseudolycoriella hygida]
MISGRALHYVFKIGDRSKNAKFFREILGMKVLRHEEFQEGCDAQCNGPYNNRWSKTMIGYGPEDDHFVIELTYNYGVKSYALGNDFGGITIRSKEVIDRAKAQNYPITSDNVLVSPDGYKFYIIPEDQPTNDPVVSVALNCTDLHKSIEFWNKVLEMELISQSDNAAVFLYKENAVQLELKKIDSPMNREKAYGRIAFAVPYESQPHIDEMEVKDLTSTLQKIHFNNILHVQSKPLRFEFGSR